MEIKNTSYVATEIDWDTDDDDDVNDLDLPETVKLPSELDIFEDDEAVANYLSDTYGWCVNSCRIKRLSEAGSL